MHFNDEKQTHGVCRALLATIGRADLWTDEGPTEEAVRLEESDGEGLEPEHRVLFFMVWDMYRPTLPSRASFGDLLFNLGIIPKRALMRLLLAYSISSGGIDAWLASADHLATKDEVLLGVLDGPLGHKLARELLAAAKRKPGTGEA
jgi:hypothetical protein